MTMTKIASATGTGSSATLEFTGIPATYTDLLLVVSARGVSGSHPGYSLTVNGSTSTNLSSRYLYGSGSSAASGSSASGINLGQMSGSSETANTYASLSVYMTNYTGSSAKGISVDSADENNGAGAYQFLTAGLYNSSTAVTSIGVVGSVNLTSDSTATLYGILKGSGGATVS